MVEDQGPSDYERKISEVLRLGETLSELEGEIRELGTKFSQRKERRRTKLLCAYPSIMDSDRGTVEGYLINTDPAVRRLVLGVVFDRWGADERALQLYRKVAMEDHDAKVRAAAIYKIGAGSSSSSNRDSSRLVMRILMNETESPDTRRAAYYALLLMNGFDALKLLPPSMFRFPDDVDWSIVSKLSESGGDAGSP